MPPQVIKTGLLGSAEAVATVARWVDRLRQRAPVALVVDPVQAASTGAVFADEAATQAYRDLLLPRASLITPNRREAAWLLGAEQARDNGSVPQQARAFALGRRRSGLHHRRRRCRPGRPGAGLVGQPSRRGLAGVRTCPYASCARHRLHICHCRGLRAGAGFRGGRCAGPGQDGYLAGVARAARRRGRGAGPVRARAGFASNPALLPRLSWGERAGLCVSTGATRAPAGAVCRGGQRSAGPAGTGGWRDHGAIADQGRGGFGRLARRVAHGHCGCACGPARCCSSTTIGKLALELGGRGRAPGAGRPAGAR